MTGEGKIEKVMHEFKSGTLRSGGSGKKVKSRKQALAIALSEARRAGAKIPHSSPEWSQDELLRGYRAVQ